MTVQKLCVHLAVVSWLLGGVVLAQPPAGMAPAHAVPQQKGPAPAIQAAGAPAAKKPVCTESAVKTTALSATSSLADATDCAKTQRDILADSEAALNAALAASGSSPFDKASALQSALKDATEAVSELTAVQTAWGTDSTKSQDAANLKTYVDRLNESLTDATKTLATATQAMAKALTPAPASAAPASAPAKPADTQPCKGPDGKAPATTLADAKKCVQDQATALDQAIVTLNLTLTPKGSVPYQEAESLNAALKTPEAAATQLQAIAQSWAPDSSKASEVDDLNSSLKTLTGKIDEAKRALGAANEQIQTNTGGQLTEIHDLYESAQGSLALAKAQAYSDELGQAAARVEECGAAAGSVAVANLKAALDKAIQAAKDADAAAKADPGKPDAAVQAHKTLNAATDAYDKAVEEVCRNASSRARDKEVEATNRYTRQNGTEVRTIIGFEQTGAVNADAAQNLFMDLFLSHPLAFWHDMGDKSKGERDALGPPLRYFGDIRISSAPQQLNSVLTDNLYALAGSPATLKANQIGQSGDFLVGMTYRFGSFAKPFFRQVGDKERISLNLLVAVGGIGSFAQPSNTPTAYVFPTGTSQQQVDALCNLGLVGLTCTGGSNGVGQTLPAAYSYLAFKPTSHGNQFFRQGYAGVRLASQDACNAYPGSPCNRAGIRLDITFGENEAVTNGTFRHPVWRFESFVPIPIKAGGALDSVIYFFASFYLNADRTNLETQAQEGLQALILQPAPSSWNTATPGTFYVPALPSWRDYYRLGFGIDLLRLITNQTNNSGQKQPATTPPATGTATPTAKTAGQTTPPAPALDAKKKAAKAPTAQ
ncbi:MAG: hypothetical protein ACLQBJ_13185 [Bryobacteraceae bacterium]